jgi:hypothetical protein
MTALPPLTDELLRHGVAGDGDARIVTLDARFQGLPDTAHGGTVLALFDALADARDAHRARAITGVYRRRVPLATPLRLEVATDADATRFRLSDDAALLVDGAVAPLVSGDAPPAPPPRDGLPLPLSKTCFACGTENALGLHAELAIDEATVGGTWTPRDALRARDGALAPVAITALLDEAAFWLGAAASGEAGMTTELRVRLHAPAPFGRVTVAGPRATVRPRAGDPRYWDTEVAAWDARGTRIASAAITFVAVRGAARKLVAGLLAMNPPEVLRRIFPAYAR